MALRLANQAMGPPSKSTTSWDAYGDLTRLRPYSDNTVTVASRPGSHPASVMTEILTLVVIPVVLALLGLTWPSVLAMHRGRRFRGLILRELEETSPWPLDPPDQPAKGGELRGPWWARHQKNFVHREILADPSSNRDFISAWIPHSSIW
jgi:hypothetical protein